MAVQRALVPFATRAIEVRAIVHRELMLVVVALVEMIEGPGGRGLVENVVAPFAAVRTRHLELEQVHQFVANDIARLARIEHGIRRHPHPAGARAFARQIGHDLRLLAHPDAGDIDVDGAVTAVAGQLRIGQGRRAEHRQQLVVILLDGRRHVERGGLHVFCRVQVQLGIAVSMTVGYQILKLAVRITFQPGSVSAVGMPASRSKQESAAARRIHAAAR